MKLIVFSLHIIVFGFVYPLQVIMERASVTNLNEKYLEWAKAYVNRFGRKSPYYLNVEGKTKHEWTNNITLHLLFYEFLHNEYRRTFVEMHLKLCDALNSEPYVGRMLARSGVVCPLPAATHRVMNMTVEAAEFPNVWPFRKAKVMVELATTEGKEIAGVIEVFITFLQKKKNG